MYRIKLDVFEGPFDLLVYLIETSEMDICDIQIAEITVQYIEYIKQMQALNIEIAQEFMVMAATLLQIKSRMLLPQTEDDLQLEEYEDPKKELTEKLIEYKRFKEAAAMLGAREGMMASVFTKPGEDLQKYAGEEDEYLKLGINEFLSTFKQFLDKSRRVEEVKKRYTRLERARLTVEMKIEEIFSFFKEKLYRPIFFSELISSKGDTAEEVLTFSSVLQMMKAGGVDAKQDYNFADIELFIAKRDEEENGNDNI